jgi:membrane associated rhomboid family serine protease
MDQLLARLERRVGKYAIKNLTLFIVGGMAIVFVLSMSKPEYVSALTLDVSLLKKQPWRLVTYLFIPRGTSLLVILELYWLWMIGTALENEWGAFKLNVFYFLGMLGTTAAAVIVGANVGNLFLNATLLLAFATVFPDYEIRLFFLISRARSPAAGTCGPRSSRRPRTTSSSSRGTGSTRTSRARSRFVRPRGARRCGLSTR